MLNGVPSLENALYLTDPKSIIAYTLRRYFRQPKATIPILDEYIISLPYQVAQHGKEPDVLVNNIQRDLQGVFSRIFQQDRNVTVTCNQVPVSDNEYDVTISVLYSLATGEITQTGTTISLVKGRLVIPEDTIKPTLER